MKRKRWQVLCGYGTKLPRRLTRNMIGNEYLLRLENPFAKGTRLPGTSCPKLVTVRSWRNW